jgi:hypothetical protein
MFGSSRRAWFVVLGVLAGLSLFLWIGCDSVEPMGPDTTPPTGTTITNPPDGTAINSSLINVRGRAEVGATVRVLVDDIDAGSAVASPAVPNDGELGRFTVEGVNLGESDGSKNLKAITTDLYGNVTDEPVEIDILLDMTPPPIAFETINHADWVDSTQYWLSGVPRIRLVGRTDTLAAGARARHGVQEYLPDSSYVFPGEPGEPDSMRFWVTLSTPPLTTAAPESLITYMVEAYDAAGNVNGVPVDVLWSAEGKDTTLSWLEVEVPISFEDYITGQAGMMEAVMFQAPVWANYVIGVRFFIGNDGITDPQNPETPTTKPFTIWVWRPTADSTPRPGVAANDGMNTGSQYPEMEWLQKILPNAVDISNNSYFADKQFFVGLEWDNRNNPLVGIDATIGAVDYTTWRLPWEPPWLMLESGDAMIEAIVSDIPNIAEGRIAVIGRGGRVREISR